MSISSVVQRISPRVLVVCACALFATGVLAQHAAPSRIAPNALLTIDQNRSTVVERIVSEWGDAVAQSNSIDREQLRTMLLAMRADHLLAASLAGNVEGLRNVLANALTSTADVKANMLHAKALGDSAADLVYTPVAPCRILDTRNFGGVFAGGGETRSYHAYLTSGNFASQGGAASTCGIPANPAVAALNIATIGGGGFLTAWPYGTAQPLAATMNPAAGMVLANGALVPLCQPNCANQFSIYTFGAQVIVDIVGYFRPPQGGVFSGNIAVAGTALLTNVGIGTNTPQTKLHVLSTTEPFPPRAESWGATGFGAGWDFYYNGTGKGYVGVPDPGALFGAGEMILFGGPNTRTSLWAGQVRSLTVASSNRPGNVGIGQLPDSNARLIVDSGANDVGIYSTSANSYGVTGVSTQGAGVYGFSTNGAGVRGVSTNNSGVYGEASVSSLNIAGVYGKNTVSGGIGVTGEANVANATGVYGVSTSATGFGMYARNTSGWALFADGNVRQTRDKGGFVKAVLEVEGNTINNTAFIMRCYNGVTGVSTGGCGFTVSRVTNGIYRIDFGFQVNDRFMVVTGRYDSGPSNNNIGANYRVFSTNVAEVFTFESGNSADTADAAFTIVVY